MSKSANSNEKEKHASTVKPACFIKESKSLALFCYDNEHFQHQVILPQMAALYLVSNSKQEPYEMILEGFLFHQKEGYMITFYS